MIAYRTAAARHLLAALLVFSVFVDFPAPATAAPDIWFDDTLVSELKAGLICSLRADGERAAPDTELGSITIINQPPEIAWQGTLVPAVPGLSFGVIAQARGPDPLEGLRLTVEHPPFAGTGTRRQSWSMEILPDEPTGNTYSFDFPHELVTGRWLFESRAPDGTLVYRVRFQVVPPEAAPSLAHLCEGDALISQVAPPISPADPA